MSDAYYDAQLKNDITRNVRQYRDLDLFFSEKPFHPEIGSGIRSILFQPMSPITAYVLSRKVEEVIENFEPRVKLVGVRAIPDLDRNSYEVTIEFYVLNAPTELAELTVLLERSR